jgi:hypothetical protein
LPNAGQQYTTAAGFTPLGNSGTGSNSGVATTGITVRDTTGGGGTANQTATNGSGTAHNNVQPSFVIGKIIKT